MRFRKTRQALKGLVRPIKKLVVSYKPKKRHERKKAHFTKAAQNVGGLTEVQGEELSGIRNQIKEALEKKDKKTADGLAKRHNELLHSFIENFEHKRKHLLRHIPRKP